MVKYIITLIIIFTHMIFFQYVMTMTIEEYILKKIRKHFFIIFENCLKS